MVNRNIQMKKRNNDQWENLFPLSLNENIYNSEGQSLEDQLFNLTQEIETADKELNALISNANKELKKLNNDITTANETITKLNKDTRKREDGTIYASDYSKLSNETDDEFINRLLGLLPKGYGTLILEGKDYVLHKPIIINEYQQLKGAGVLTNLIGQTASEIIKFKSYEEKDTYGVTIEDLSLTGNNRNTGILFARASHFYMKNVYIYETKWGIWGDNLWLGELDRVTIRNYEIYGELGYRIGGGTSNLLNNVWVVKFNKGYDISTYYSTLNSCACDSFKDYAYKTRQNTTLNGCGAESGSLSKDGAVFIMGARGGTYNSCEVMNIESKALKGEVAYFQFTGTHASINNFRNAGSYSDDKIDIFHLYMDTSILVNNYRIENFNKEYQFLGDSHAGTITIKDRTTLRFCRWNGEKDLIPSS